MINYKKARKDFEKDGYLIIKNFYSKKKCNVLTISANTYKDKSDNNPPQS